MRNAWATQGCMLERLQRSPAVMQSMVIGGALVETGNAIDARGESGAEAAAVQNSSRTRGAVGIATRLEARRFLNPRVIHG